jgi:hypothetical protein
MGVIGGMYVPLKIKQFFKSEIGKPFLDILKCPKMKSWLKNPKNPFF